MSKNRVVIIIPYFGKFPNYFNFWLKSALENKDFDFLFFTDNTNYQTYRNIKFIHMSFENFKKILQSKVEFKINLYEPYKICDYRPLFGEALQQYINGYEFWGFGDVDLILGKLDNFITPSILNKYDKIYDLGHLTLLRNISKCNSLWRVKHHIPNAYRYDEAFKTKCACHFDEMFGLTEIAKFKKIKTYHSIDFADIDRSKFNFFMIGRQNKVRQGLFEWKGGILKYYYLDNNIYNEEVAYAHFQKRPMEVVNPKKNISQFLMIPNKIISNANHLSYLKNVKVKKIYSFYYKSRLEEMVRNVIHHDALQQRFYRRFLRRNYRKNILDKR